MGAVKGGEAPRAQRGALIGTIVAGVAGAAWAVWGASGLPGALAVAVTIVGVAAGAVLVALAARALPRAASDAPSMFRTRTYRITVAGEVAAIAAGSAVLGATGHRTYIITWVALVVGLHFVVFGHRFRAFYHRVGAALVVAAALGAILGVSGARPEVVVSVTGLLSAATLLGAGARGYTRPPI